MKQIFLLLFSTLFFSLVIFLFKNTFFGDSHHISHIEDHYIEAHPESHHHLEEEDDIELQAPSEDEKRRIIERELKTYFENKNKAKFYYIPSSFVPKVKSYTRTIEVFLDHRLIKNKIYDLQVHLYEKLFDVRGKMQDRTLKLFGVLEMSEREFLAVSIHEFAHYADLYFLQKSVRKDVSDYFYEISWESSKVILPGQKQKDFVSGYAMTNKYEDFAESFTYYVLHNEDFLEKSKKSQFLKQKYDFFSRNLFSTREFVGTDFSENKMKSYYWDTTKIEYNLEKFLLFLES